MREVIVNIILYSIEMLIAYMYFNRLFVKRQKVKFILLVSEILYLFISIFNIVFSNIVLNIILFLIINIIMALVNYHITFRQAVAHAIILTAVMLICECIVVFSASTLSTVEFTSYQQNFAVLLTEAALSKILYSILCFALNKRKKSTQDIKAKAPIYLFIFPICSVMMLLLLISVSQTYIVSITLNRLISFLSIALLLSVVLTYVLYDNYAKKEAELFELRNQLFKFETDKAYYQILERQNDEIHAFSHNTKNHFQVIKSLTNEKSVEEYVDKCYEKLDKFSAFGKTKNKILDIIINKYSVLCEIKKIDFVVSIKTANLSYIKDDELSVLLSCIIDNAVEAAEKTDERRIEFNLNQQGFFDVLTCINSCNPDPNLKSSILKTTKANTQIHGFGIRNIRQIAKKNNAEYSHTYDEINKEFITTIIFERS